MAIGSIGGLLLGLAVGTASHGSDAGAITAIEPYIKAVGALWLNALSALVLPLTVVNVISAVIRSRNAKHTGIIGAQAMALFVGALVLAAAFTLVLVPPLLSKLPVDAGFTASLSQSLPEEARQAAARPALGTTPAEIVSAFVPRNLLKSALNDELLPVLIFAIAFAFAIGRIKGPYQEILAGFFGGLAEALFVLVGWILLFMPVGAFALAFAFSIDAGAGVAGVLGQFTLFTCGAMLAFTLLLYPLTALAGRVSVKRFAAAVLPAQISAISTRSSIASLPALLAGASTLRMDPAVANLALPLSVAVFKVNRTVSATVKMLFLAHLFGVPLGPVQVITFIITVIILSFTALGIPGGGAAFKTMAAYLAVGLPIEGVVLLEAADVVADIFKTLLNVTGDMSVATVLARISGRTNVEGSMGMAPREGFTLDDGERTV
ncbi:MAG: cation:dicarboxylase symporter family transporter [Phycisphaerae bacterium]|nr:cation:dicarboxylase symporter family transporter [Gemmatimonadaceae bacterium]